jgi:hypothetical protein
MENTVTRAMAPIDLIERIGETIKQLKAEEKPGLLLNEDVQRYIKELSKMIELGYYESLFLALIMYLSITDEEVTAKDIARLIDLPLSGYPDMYKALDNLTIESHVFKNESFVGRFDYCLTPEVKDALFNRRSPRAINLKTDLYGMSDFMEQYLDHVNSRRVSIQQASIFIHKLCAENPQLPVAEYILKYKLEPDDILWTMVLYTQAMNKTEGCNIMEVLNEYFRKAKERLFSKRKMLQSKSILHKHKIIEWEGQELQTPDSIQLTALGFKVFFGKEIRSARQLKNKHMQHALTPKNIPTKKLFYNHDTTSDIEELSAIIEPGKFKQIQSNLKKHGLKSGICCLFQGAPGTGKTETVYQLAKKSNRMVLKIDFAYLKDKYVGESEKRVRETFAEYRQLLIQEKRVPILLMNEADGLLGRRIPVSSSVDQMNNTIQNILLEEMEQFEGILIATTNLKKNLDDAFMRRFIFNVKFEMPDIETRKKILTNNFPQLSCSAVNEISSGYNMTGARIENILRKIKMLNSIKHSNISESEIIELFKKDNIINSGRKRIKGFSTEKDNSYI